jgi:tetratricopeptide (TPR) repeat protein
MQWGRLDDRLAAAQTPREAALVLALKGEGLARLGHPAEARQEITRARRALADRGDATATCAILLAEALALHHEGEAGAGRQALARAVAIARSAGVAEQAAYAQAWVAQFEANDGHLNASLQALSAALALLGPDNLRARARLAVVIAGWAAEGGDLEQARVWCDSARAQASREGDTAMQAGVLAHMAAIWTDEMRVRECLEGVAPLPASQVMLLVQSSINFDRVLGSRTLGWCAPVMLADVLWRDGDAPAALALYEQALAGIEGATLAPVEACVRADMAECLQRLDRRREAAQMAQRAEAVLHQLTHPDDRFVALSRLAGVYAAVGLPDKAAHHAAKAGVERRTLCARRAAIRSELEALLERVGLASPWPLEPAARSQGLAGASAVPLSPGHA